MPAGPGGAGLGIEELLAFAVALRPPTTPGLVKSLWNSGSAEFAGVAARTESVPMERSR